MWRERIRHTRYAGEVHAGEVSTCRRTFSVFSIYTAAPLLGWCENIVMKRQPVEHIYLLAAVPRQEGECLRLRR